MKTRDMSLTALLAVVILITGIFKIPGIVPGTEFQLSAPIAIAIAVCFGFKRYFLAGLVSSAISLIIGSHTIVNVTISMIFRIIAGGLIHILGPKLIVIILAGPLASFISRLILGLIIGKAITPLVIAAVPGMIYTAILSAPVTKLVLKIKSTTSWKEAESYERTL